MHRAPAYWPARIMLGVGVIATVLVVGCAVLVGTQEPMFGEPSRLFGVTQNLAAAFAASGIALFGLIWQIRIFRGSRDEPPAWRYRNRR